MVVAAAVAVEDTAGIAIVALETPLTALVLVINITNIISITTHPFPSIEAVLLKVTMVPAN